MNIQLDQPGPQRESERLDMARLAEYLNAHLDDRSAERLKVEQFPSGYSNLTYAISWGGRELVLRRPPFGNQVKSAHDMGREFRVLSKLWKVYPLAPRPYLYCEDTSIIGAEFYLMQRRRGVILRGIKPPVPLESSAALTRALCLAFVDRLVELHQIDYMAAGLGDVGRPQGYTERQVNGWTRRYADARTEELPDMETMAQWLADHRPGDRSTALIHNDYKYDNLILDSNDLTQVVAVLDWEMATLGDPLMDLGTALAYWVDATDSELMKAQAFGPTMLPGSLSRKELVARYAEQSGVDVSDALFYYCFGMFKLAVIIQQIYARYVRGHTTDRRFAKLNETVAAIARASLAARDRGEY